MGEEVTTQPKIIEMPLGAKTIPCDKCGREIVVGRNTVLAFCRECSANLGVKR